jgi:uncharacterized membrane protein YfcA
LADVPSWLALFIGGWLAATVSGVAGFGGALLLLPALASILGAKAAVPVLTIAQLLGNASRAGFGWRQINWRPVFWFVGGAVPASVVGGSAFVALPQAGVNAGIAILLVGVVAARRLGLAKLPLRGWSFLMGGAATGFISAVVGSAGPLGAAIFLGLGLPPASYVASEAVTAFAIHVTKTAVYGRYALVGPTELLAGLYIGAAMVLGSWTGRRIVDRLPRSAFALVVEVLLLASAAQLAAQAVK